jgi:hypothetical protein
MVDWNKTLQVVSTQKNWVVKRGNERYVAQMGWEKRGSYEYYYRKEREGSRVKSTYLGRGEIAKMVSQIQSSSPVIEKLARSREPNDIKAESAELLFEQVTQLLTEAALLTAGFHSHHRQWRRKRNVEID